MKARTYKLRCTATAKVLFSMFPGIYPIVGDFCHSKQLESINWLTDEGSG
jgi:hypothetical protein